MTKQIQTDRDPVVHPDLPTDDRPFVETVFKPDGSVEVRAHGFAGGTCQQALEPYLKSLQGDIVADTPTSEACQTPAGRIAAPRHREKA